MIDPSYHPIYQQAKALHDDFHDSLDDKNNPTAHVVWREMRQLYEDMESGKHPKDWEHRARTIQNQLRQASNANHSYISTDHANSFHRSYENMVRDIRKLPHYR